MHEEDLDPRQLGYYNYFQDVSQLDNPFRLDERAYDEWDEGWLEGAEESQQYRSVYYDD